MATYRALLFDDDSDFLGLLGQFVESEGFVLIRAATLQQASFSVGPTGAVFSAFDGNAASLSFDGDSAAFGRVAGLELAGVCS